MKPQRSKADYGRRGVGHYDARRRGRGPDRKETIYEQISSFVGFFIYLLVLKTFFLPLFVIPTGSMAETLYGAHATHTCPSCGLEYAIGFSGEPPRPPPILQCPNCRWREQHPGSDRVALGQMRARGVTVDGGLRRAVRRRGGDRIMVHGWPYELGGRFAPQRWDVVVFKVPSDGQTNYIKRLIGLPGETVEIIDGDVFVTDPQTGQTRIARKTPQAQEALWFPYYDHDYPPQRPGADGQYHPRWVAMRGAEGWQNLEGRRPRFDGLGNAGEIRFVTAPGSTVEPGKIEDIYGYDGVRPMEQVTDVRLSCEVSIHAAGTRAFVELGLTKYDDEFFARLYADGRLTLEHARRGGTGRELWAERSVSLGRRPVHLALSNVDYVVSVAVDGRIELQSTPQQYDIDADQARKQSQRKTPPRLSVAASDIQVTLSHLLIERDVYYTSDVEVGLDRRPGWGTQGHPIRLGPNDYFLLGDNSPASLDCRFSFIQADPNRGIQTDPVGPHLKAALERGEYQLGVVPGDQLIGPAFFVYWPGTSELLPDEVLPRFLQKLNHLPNPGRIRAIH